MNENNESLNLINITCFNFFYFFFYIRNEISVANKYHSYTITFRVPMSLMPWGTSSGKSQNSSTHTGCSSVQYPLLWQVLQEGGVAMKKEILDKRNIFTFPN